MPVAYTPKSEFEIIRGRIPSPNEKEFREMMNYESGQADKDAANVPGPHAEPWLNVIDKCEPASLPGFARMLEIPEIRSKLRGQALDLGAGTGWLSAKLSRLAEVETVYAMDLSENFLRTTAARIMRHFGAEFKKVKLVVGDFNAIPFEDGSLDCIFLWAALHHSLSPIKTLREVARCLKPGGVLVVFEMPHCTRRIVESRKQMLAMSENVTEIAYTLGELKYLLANAQLGKVQTFPVDVLSTGGLKMLVRRFLRWLNLEAHLISPPCYAFLVHKR